jgi:NADPH:quinone reductase-like Zn-dependent oxidoreductase
LRQDADSALPAIVGYFAIQLARLHGYVVTTTCGTQNFDYLKKAGATNVFDYSDPEVVEKIRDLLPPLGHVFDTIGSIDSSPNAAAALNDGGMFCTVRPGKTNTQGIPKNVDITDVFVFTAFPTPHTYRGAAHWPVSLGDISFVADLH